MRDCENIIGVMAAADGLVVCILHSNQSYIGILTVHRIAYNDNQPGTPLNSSGIEGKTHLSSLLRSFAA